MPETKPEKRPSNNPRGRPARLTNDQRRLFTVSLKVRRAHQATVKLAALAARAAAEASS